MKKIISILILLSIILFTSCSIENEAESRLFIVSVALNYGGPDGKHPNILNGTLNDQKSLIDQFIILSENYDKKTSIYQLTEEDDNYSITYMDHTNNYVRDNITRNNSKKSLCDDIEDTLELIANEVTKNDTLIFLYSGHGILNNNDVNNELTGCLMIGTETVFDEQAQKNPETQVILYLRPSTLTRWLDNIDCNKVVILDSCYSGKILNNDEYTKSTTLFSGYPDYFSDYSKNTRFWALIASAEDEVSFEYSHLGEKNEPHGVFSYSLLKALGYEGETEYTNKRITASSLFKDTLDKFNRIWFLHNLGKNKQHPKSTANFYDLVLFD